MIFCAITPSPSVGNLNGIVRTSYEYAITITSHCVIVYYCIFNLRQADVTNNFHTVWFIQIEHVPNCHMVFDYIMRYHTVTSNAQKNRIPCGYYR